MAYGTESCGLSAYALIILMKLFDSFKTRTRKGIIKGSVLLNGKKGDERKLAWRSPIVTLFSSIRNTRNRFNGG